MVSFALSKCLPAVIKCAGFCKSAVPIFQFVFVSIMVEHFQLTKWRQTLLTIDFICFLLEFYELNIAAELYRISTILSVILQVDSISHRFVLIVIFVITQNLWHCSNQLSISKILTGKYSLPGTSNLLTSMVVVLEWYLRTSFEHIVCLNSRSLKDIM